jgi:hypothetical protein
LASCLATSSDKVTSPQGAVHIPKILHKNACTLRK